MEIFWIFVFAIILLIAAGLDGFGVALFLAAIVGGLWLTIGAITPVATWIFHNPITFTAGLGIYLTIGVAWSFFKWYKFVLKNTSYIDKIKSAAKKLDISPIEYYLGRLPPEAKDIDKVSRINILDYQPKAINHIDKLSTWWICWPTSVIRYVIGDFLYDITKNIVKWFGGLYTQVTEYAIKSLLK